MVSSLIALLVIAPPLQDAQAKPPKASELVGKMFARYNKLNSLTGTIKLQQQLMNTKIVIDTSVQYERPNFLYLSQVKTGGITPGKWLVTSDGKHFSYDTPEMMKVDPNQNRKYARLIESVNGGGTQLDYQMIYKASSASLGDRSAPLDVAINNIYDLDFLRGQWATLEMDGKKDYNGTEVFSVSGKWRDYKTAPHISGTYQMLITAEGDLKRYAIKQIITATTSDPSKGVPPSELISVWDVDLTPNGKPDKNLFALVR